MQIGTFDVERSKRHDFDELSRSVYIFAQRNLPCETLSLRELTMQVLLDLELYRILKKRCRFRATFCQVKYGVLKLIILSTKRGSNFPKIM